MRTDSVVVGDRHAGFTLIEVLIALVVLGIGMLSVQALGVTAARSVALADQNTEFAIAASHHLEQTLDAIRSGSSPPCGTATVDDAMPTFTVERQVARTAVGTGTQIDVTIRAIPKDGAAAPLRPMELVGTVFTPTAAGC